MSRMIECDSCGTTLRASDRLAGRKVRCPRCRSIIRVASEESEPLDDLVLAEPDDPPTPVLPRRRPPTLTARKKRHSRNSLRIDTPATISRYWTLGAGVLLIVATLFIPTPGLFLAIPLGALSIVTIFVIMLMLGVPIVLEHPFLLLQLVLFGGGIGRYTPEQMERGAARVRSFWPVLSHAALAASCCVLAVMAGVCSPSLPPNSPFAIKPRPQQQIGAARSTAAPSGRTGNAGGQPRACRSCRRGLAGDRGRTP